MLAQDSNYPGENPIEMKLVQRGVSTTAYTPEQVDPVAVDSSHVNRYFSTTMLQSILNGFRVSGNTHAFT